MAANRAILRLTTLYLVFLILPLLFILPMPTYAWTKRSDAHGKTIIAYYASWQWYDRNGAAKPSNLDHSKVTRYNFAFFQINEAGDIWGTDSWADAIVLFGEFDWSAVPGAGGAEYCSWDHPDEPPVCAGHHYETGLISQAHEAGVEVYPSIGGWTLSDPFSKLAEDPVARKNFAANCVRLIEAYDFDGIDIDWEYPGYADHSGRPVDTVNYSLFLKEIRDALDELGSRTGRFYGLTAALPCGPDLIDNIQIDVVKDIMTEFNLMTYDFHGSWNTETGANAPLYDMEGSAEFSVDSCVKNWHKSGAGARPEQINIGLPFYGRSFAGQGLTGFGQTHAGYADTVTWSDDEGSPQYFNIVDKMAQFTTARDVETMTQFMYNNVGFVSYDDPRAICDKTEYAMDNKLNGYIIWEISGDVLADGSTPLLDAANDRLNNPNVRCMPAGEVTNDVVVGGGSDGGTATTTLTSATAAVTGSPWYPSQSLGYCVSDGKQLSNFIAPDQIFASAAACCKAIYQHNGNCLASSTNPGSDGHWVPLGDVAAENPWYPHPSLGYCVNDGKHKDHSTLASALFTSAEACCDGIYSFSSTCLNSSLEPGSDGKWNANVNEGNPWYPHAKLGACISDGKQKQNSIEDYHMFNSAEACCDAVYSFDANCVSKSLDTIANANEVKWYPFGNICTSESPVPSWVLIVYDTEEECCLDYFGETNPSCSYGGNAATPDATAVSDPTPSATLPQNSLSPGELKWYPFSGTCIWGPVPLWVMDVYDSQEDCCEDYFEEAVATCIADVTAVTTSATGAAVLDPVATSPTNNIQSTTNDGDPDSLFYPSYGESGLTVECLNDDKAPTWITKKMMTDNRYDCCASYYDPSVTAQCNTDRPYYPKFEDTSCVNDGKQPSWMAGNYLVDNKWLCCHNFYQHDEALLKQCTKE